MSTFTDKNMGGVTSVHGMNGVRRIDPIRPINSTFIKSKQSSGDESSLQRDIVNTTEADRLGYLMHALGAYSSDYPPLSTEGWTKVLEDLTLGVYEVDVARLSVLIKDLI